jgi:hypothetical protein
MEDSTQLGRPSKLELLLAASAMLLVECVLCVLRGGEVAV